MKKTPFCGSVLSLFITAPVLVCKVGASEPGPCALHGILEAPIKKARINSVVDFRINDFFTDDVDYMWIICVLFKIPYYI